MTLVHRATHVLQWWRQSVTMVKPGVNHQKLPQFGLFSESRKHEVEIVSNRKLVRYGEFKIKFCTHRPSRSENDENRMF